MAGMSPKGDFMSLLLIGGEGKKSAMLDFSGF